MSRLDGRPGWMDVPMDGDRRDARDASTDARCVDARAMRLASASTRVALRSPAFGARRRHRASLAQASMRVAPPNGGRYACGARTAFAHTAAVWSMVGHVVGLGDRHGENILLDQESGDCVHVDFSCLFDKGLELETPEMGPFRLTQNIVDGLGAGGYEGVFMRASEITLSVLRSHREALMSVLETFVHDPLVEWSAARKNGGGRRGETEAGGRGKEALDKITSRLEGVVVGVTNYVGREREYITYLGRDSLLSDFSIEIRHLFATISA